MYEIRPLRTTDAPAMLDAYERNRHHLAPWEPLRGDGFYTIAAQERMVADKLRAADSGTGASWVVVDGARVVGAASLSNIVRGVFQSCDLGYWVDADLLGRGLATRTVRTACDWASQHALHRVQAATMLTNAASERVLEKCGFTRIGTAPAYLKIAGAWRDHLLWQVTFDADASSRGHQQPDRRDP